MSWLPSSWRGLRRRDWLARAVVAWCLGCLAYGFVHFPDAPYKPCGPRQFCGKYDAPHTRAQYDAFLLWQRTLFLSAPFGMAAGWFLRARRR